jgi:hypothetical protein
MAQEMQQVGPLEMEEAEEALELAGPAVVVLVGLAMERMGLLLPM